jgi:hypothetical protein
MGDDVVLSMVNSHPGRYSVTTDEIISLKQAGASDKIIAAMINKGAPVSGLQTPPASTEPLTLRDDAPVRLRLARNISSEDAATGERVDFEVVEDVESTA